MIWIGENNEYNQFVPNQVKGISILKERGWDISPF